MKNIFRTLTILGLLGSSVFATDKIQTVLVTTPVYHTEDEGGVKFAKIPYTGWDIENPFYSCAYYSSPRVAFEDQKHLKQDINLLSVYRIEAQSNYDAGVTTIYLSIANATKPETHRFTIKEVVEFARIAVRADFPDQEKYVIKITEKSIRDIFSELRKRNNN